MRFFIDENTSPRFAESVRLVLPQHDFIHCYDLGMSGVLDIPMIQTLAKRGDIDAMITKDTNQWTNPKERAAIIKSQMHWLSHREPPYSGPRQVAFLTAAYLAALDIVVERIDDSGKTVWCRINHIPYAGPQRVKFFG